MTNQELIKQHDESTMMCSFAGHMRECSSTYNEIIAKGMDIVPDILKYLKDGQPSMSVMMLLEDIVQESPYEPEPIAGNDGTPVAGWGAYNVSDYGKAWIKWGEKKGLC